MKPESEKVELEQRLAKIEEVLLRLVQQFPFEWKDIDLSFLNKDKDTNDTNK